MFGIGMPEMIVILAVALIVIGPKKLPDLAKSLGKAMSEFRKATSEIRDSFEIDDDMDEIKKGPDEIGKDAKSLLQEKEKPLSPMETKVGEQIKPEKDKILDGKGAAKNGSG